jgi:hypothetical protein
MPIVGPAWLAKADARFSLDRCPDPDECISEKKALPSLSCWSEVTRPIEVEASLILAADSSLSAAACELCDFDATGVV